MPRAITTVVASEPATGQAMRNAARDAEADFGSTNRNQATILRSHRDWNSRGSI